MILNFNKVAPRPTKPSGQHNKPSWPSFAFKQVAFLDDDYDDDDDYGDDDGDGDDKYDNYDNYDAGHDDDNDNILSQANFSPRSHCEPRQSPKVVDNT